jgi:hypothetical protein
LTICTSKYFVLIVSVDRYFVFQRHRQAKYTLLSRTSLVYSPPVPLHKQHQRRPRHVQRNITDASIQQSPRPLSNSRVSTKWRPKGNARIARISSTTLVCKAGRLKYSISESRPQLMVAGKRASRLQIVAFTTSMAWNPSRVSFRRQRNHHLNVEGL